MYPLKTQSGLCQANPCCLVTDSLKGSEGQEHRILMQVTVQILTRAWNEALFLETPIGVYISVSAFSYECVRNGNPVHYSCLENPMDRGAWRAAVHGVPRVGHDLVPKPPCAPGYRTCGSVCACVSWWAKMATRDYHTKLSKSDRKENTIWYGLCVESEKSVPNELVYKMEIDSPT